MFGKLLNVSHFLSYFPLHLLPLSLFPSLPLSLFPFFPPFLPPSLTISPSLPPSLSLLSLISPASGHMVSRAGRCSVWVALHILVLRITRFWTTSPLEEGSRNPHFVLINCELDNTYYWVTPPIRTLKNHRTMRIKQGFAVLLALAGSQFLILLL